MKTLFKCMGGLVLGGGLLWPGGVNATELTVGTEYIYPTRYEVQGGQIQAGQNGRAGIVQETVVVPTEFATRMVGVKFTVEATVSGMNRDAATIAAMEPRNKNGNTELMIAATLGKVADVRTLLSRGAFVNTRNSFGSTALMGAAAGGYEDIVGLLLQKNAKTDVKSKNGSTALIFAARNGHLNVVEQLLKAGASANEKDNEGISALMYAIQGGDSEVVEKLLKSGAKPDHTDRFGTTPIILAQKKNDQAILVMLTRGAGGK